MARQKSVAAQLKALDSEGFGDVEPFDDTSFEEVPSGKYIAKCDDVTVANAKSGEGRLQATFELKIVDGEFIGRKVWKREGLETGDNLRALRTQLARVEYEWPAKATDLPELLGELVGQYIDISIRQKGEFTNIYFNSLHDADDIVEDREDNEEENNAEGWGVGDACQVDFEGEMYAGEVTAISDDDVATVEFEDGGTEDVPFNELVEVEGEEEPETDTADEAADSWVGTNVTVDYDGEAYSGVVTHDADGTLTVEFEDGSTDDVSEDDVTAVEDEGEGEEGEGSEEGGDDELGFDGKVSAKDKKAILALGKEHEYEAADYKGEEGAMLIDIAEYLGVEGHYESADELITQCVNL